MFYLPAYPSNQAKIVDGCSGRCRKARRRRHDRLAAGRTSLGAAGASEDGGEGGNICRSPIAEAVFRKLVTDAKVENKWRIDSAATSTYEIGNPPDYRGQTCMKKHGITMNHIARLLKKISRPLIIYFVWMKAI
ncbi:low molecular weight phosphotyrosine protein phosphatase isoform X6 [Apteryx rowi]|uniref:low molecular weight phosphotyrosine protein phosphatase isoform X6 n=1 Tax=Apteryx rowi TaxID=308060 RepID=UPI000E1D9B59|nr:low molecular weight phosphotyrosine protein phosphatase isoform X6 [Apteryx rowi]